MHFIFQNILFATYMYATLTHWAAVMVQFLSATQYNVKSQINHDNLETSCRLILSDKYAMTWKADMLPAHSSFINVSKCNLSNSHT